MTEIAIRKAGPRDRRRGFTLLEVLVASLIMGIAVSGILSGLAAASRNASRLTAYDRATLLGREQMDELLADQKAPRNVLLQGTFPPQRFGDAAVGWRARVTAFEVAPDATPGRWCVDRVALEIWWLDGQTTHSFSLEVRQHRRSRFPPSRRSRSKCPCKWQTEETCRRPCGSASL